MINLLRRFLRNITPKKIKNDKTHIHPTQPDNERIFKSNRLKAVMKVYENSFNFSRRDFMIHVSGWATAFATLIILRFGFNVGNARIKKLVERVGYKKITNEINKIENRNELDNTKKIILKAWKDENFLQNLLKNPEKTIRQNNFPLEKADYKLVFVQNSNEIHNLTVCTLCGCYPENLLGSPPSWYKSFEYRSKAVYEPLELLKEFGFNPQFKKIIVHDSDLFTRYVIIPKKPKNIKRYSDKYLKSLITRDSLIGVSD